MSVPDDLRFDADGFVDMDAFPDDGTELDPAALSDLREVLLSDPVTEPDAVGWDALLDAALDAPVDEGPFAVDGSEAPATDVLLDPSGEDPSGGLDPDLGAEAGDATDVALDEPFDAADDPQGVDVLDALALDAGAGADDDPFDPGLGSDGEAAAGDAGFDVGDVL